MATLPKPPQVKLYGSKYTSGGKIGDFNWEINQQNIQSYKRTLYIFNDNIEKQHTNEPGDGNAAIRKYNKYSGENLFRSAGICTGSLDTRGYTQLDATVIKVINKNLLDIKELLYTGFNWTRIIWCKFRYEL